MANCANETFRAQLEADIYQETKRFQLSVDNRLLDIFDAICESAHMDRSGGFHCLILDFFSGNHYMQNLLGHHLYSEWRTKTNDFVIKNCP